MHRGVALLLCVLLAGCGRPAIPTPTSAVVVAPSRRLATTGLVLTCAHVVVEPDLVRGVLTVLNTSKESLALIDRWNSSGAFQWTLTLDGVGAGNPQISWWASHYSETVLRPGKIRHAVFLLIRRQNSLSPEEAGWRFLLGGPLGVISVDERGTPVDSSRPFATGQKLTLSLIGAGQDCTTFEGASESPLWSGTATVPSRELNALEDLRDLALSQTLF